MSSHHRLLRLGVVDPKSVSFQKRKPGKPKKEFSSSQALTTWCGRSRDSKRGEPADGSPRGDRGDHHHQQQEHHPHHHHPHHQENKDLWNMWYCTAVTPLVQQLAESPYTEQDVLHAIGLLQTNTVSIGLPVH